MPKTTELSAVAEVINRLHNEICDYAQSSFGKAIQIGELLAGQKSKLQHGEWGDWLEFNCPSIPERTASRYMMIYKDHAGKTAKIADPVSVYELLKEVFTLEEPEAEHKREETTSTQRETFGDETEEGEPESHASAHTNGDAQHEPEASTSSTQGSREPERKDDRPSPQDVIRAANQMEEAERAISSGMKAFLEVSEALLLIKQNKLYEIAQFKSFEEYCIERWGFNYRLTKRTG
jgi:hypothetical protein